MQPRTQRIIRAVDDLNITNSFYAKGFTRLDLVCTLNIVCALLNKENPSKIFNYVSSRVRNGETKDLTDKARSNKRLFN